MKRRLREDQDLKERKDAAVLKEQQKLINEIRRKSDKKSSASDKSSLNVNCEQVTIVIKKSQLADQQQQLI